MRLSEVKVGTPIRVQAFEGSTKVADIWGKVRTSGGKERQIEIYYYEGTNININNPRYDVKASIFVKGHKEQPISMNKAQIKEHPEDSINEKRDSFRIFVSVVADCILKNNSTAALVVDMSMGGFRIAVRDRDVPEGAPVMIHIEEQGFDFKLHGKVVWGKPDGPVRHIYGCQLNPGEDKSTLEAYIQLKQKQLYDHLMNEIDRG